MSFELYGPVARLSSVENLIHLAGDKMLLGKTPFRLASLTFQTITNIKYSSDFSREGELVVHRYGALPELYTGYGDGQSPRCPKPYGTCAAELERYTYGSSTTELLCPNENCNEGNLTYCMYDAKSGKVLCSTSGSGNKLYIIDPDTKAYTKLKASGASQLSHFCTVLLPYNDTYIYILIAKPADRPTSASLYRIKIDDLISLPNESIIENYAELVANIGNPLVSFRRTFTYGDKYILVYFTSWESIDRLYYLKPNGENGLFINYDGYRYFATKYAIVRTGSTSIGVYDMDQGTVVQTITTPQNASVPTPETPPPFITTYDTYYIYYYLLKYKGVAPVIQYDHIQRRIRVVDYITGNTVTADLLVYKSRLCYPLGVYPVGITPQTIRVSDWTPVPSALKAECLTFAIKDVQTGS